MTSHTRQNEIALAKKSILKRGFKAQAERLAKEYREQLNIHPCGPLCAFKLANHLKVPIYDVKEIVTQTNDLKIFSGGNGGDCEWSALTMTTEIGNTIIIHNAFHSPARQQSNVMHEIAHILCKNELIEPETDFTIPMGMRFFDEVQEEEAKCLGATLQLASPCLLWAKKRNMTNEEIAAYFNASLEMVNYRINITGIARIIS